MSQPLVSGVHICLVGEHLPAGPVHETERGYNGLFGAQCTKLHYS